MFTGRTVDGRTRRGSSRPPYTGKQNCQRLDARRARYVVYVSTNPVTKKDIWLLPQFGSQRPIPYLQTPANEIQAQVSPDGRWMAYAFDESGAWQVYVQTFPVRRMQARGVGERRRPAALAPRRTRS